MSKFAAPSVSVSASELRAASKQPIAEPPMSDNNTSGADAAAMQQLYRQVQSIYRNVKEAGSRHHRDVVPIEASPEPSTLDVSGAEGKTMARGRTAAPSTDRRKPWGYNTPVRRPSPAGARGAAPAVRTPSPAAAAVRTPSPATPRVVGPMPLTAPRAQRGPKDAVQLAPTATPAPFVRPSPKKTDGPALPLRGALPSPRRAEPSIGEERLASLEKKVHELEASLERSHERNAALESKLTACVNELRQQHAGLQGAVNQHDETLLSLSSQVAFAIAWIQQVDNHITTDHGASGADHGEAGGYHATSGHHDSSVMSSVESVSRRLEMATDPSPNTSASRLPPAPPISLLPRH